MIDPSDQLSILDKMRLQLIFGHECNKRKVGDLLDSCKTVLHETNGNGTIDEENDNQNSSGQLTDNKIDEEDGDKEGAQTDKAEDGENEESVTEHDVANTAEQTKDDSGENNEPLIRRYEKRRYIQLL
jgi:cobalamin biosynthesis protein CobT